MHFIHYHLTVFFDLKLSVNCAINFVLNQFSVENCPVFPLLQMDLPHIDYFPLFKAGGRENTVLS